jgi:hypothetical protein
MLRESAAWMGPEVLDLRGDSRTMAERVAERRCSTELASVDSQSVCQKRLGATYTEPLPFCAFVMVT